jgi:tryptophanyl-tRNA synthetase
VKTVFSGIQPTGDLHLGNYLGAVRNWVDLQGTYERAIYCIVDYHAITQPYEPKDMPRKVEDMVVDVLALGIDPERSLLFLQSMVPEHTELAWVFNSQTGFGDLERMTQFKDKIQQHGQDGRDRVKVGLFAYPVLQAADILLYKAQYVPVGEDQQQHIELARRIARSFNHEFGPTFPECEIVLTQVKRLPGLDGKEKMSKSRDNHLPLSLIGDDKALRKRLGKFVTDPQRVQRENPGNPDVCNIFTMHKALSSEADQAWVRQGCTTAGIGCVDCKNKLADNMRAHFAPYLAKRAEILARPRYVADVLEAGAAKARKIAQETMREVREKLGLWRSH